MTLTAVFSEILRMSLTAAAVILCILPVRLLLRRAPAVWRYALWAVVLFRLLCPVTVTADFAVLASDLHTGAAVHEWRDEIPSARPVPTAPQPAEVPADPAALPATAPSAAPSAADPLSVFSTIWLVGVLSMLTHSAISLARLRRSLADAEHLRGSIFCSHRTDTPFVLGVLRPKIYLPAVLSPAEQEYIVLHEQFHIRNGDHILRLLAFFALCLHWFDPLVWLAFALSGRDMEMRCDEAVLGRLGADIRADYSQSLLSLATGRRLPAGTPLAFGAGDTKRRIRNVLRWRRPTLWVSLSALALCLLVTAACAVDPKAPSDDPFGHAYAVEEITYQDGMYGFGYNEPSDAPHYRIGPEGQLLVGGTDWMPCGAFTPTA
ncbi:MAG: peptidase M56 BlaR1, partial [Butyricicoccus sp.]|nr:peptidase M56 BlaR1 [Butyricicoccus sp.]